MPKWLGSKLKPKRWRFRSRRSLARGHEVEGDLGGMHLEPEAHASRVEDVEDRAPALGEVVEAAFDRARVSAGTSRCRCQIDEPVKPFTCVTPKLRRGAGGVLHPRGARADALGIAVAPDSGGRIARWRSSMRSQTAWPTRWAPIARHRARGARAARAASRVAVVGERLVDLEVVAPARQLQSVVPNLRSGGEFGEGQVGPLAGEQCARTGHRLSVPFIRGRRSRDARGLT